MPFVVGVGLDGDARADELLQQRPEPGETFPGDLLELRPVLGHHPLVMVGGHGRQPLREKVVEGVAALHFDHFPLLPEVLDIVNEEELDAPPLPLRQLTGMGSGRVDGLVAGEGCEGLCHDSSRETGLGQKGYKTGKQYRTGKTGRAPRALQPVEV